MRITTVDAFHVDWGGSKSAWVRIWTDAGAYGLGEASPMVYGNASLEIITSAFAPMLIGANPLDQRVLQDRLYHQHIKVGPEGAYAGPLAALLHAHYPCEYNGPHGVQDVVFSRPVTPLRGKFILPDAPGLGLDIVEAELQ